MGYNFSRENFFNRVFICSEEVLSQSTEYFDMSILFGLHARFDFKRKDKVSVEPVRLQLYCITYTV